MSTIAFPERSRVMLRPLALPSEHGGWGFLLEPIVLGLLVAPSVGGLLIGLGATAAFLARHPLKLAAQDWRRHRRYPRTRACELIALGYTALALLFFAGAPLRALIALGAALPFAVAQFAFDVRNRGRALMPEMFGVLAPGAIAAAIAIAAGRPIAFAASLWALLTLRSIPSILYVRASLKGFSTRIMLAAHVVAIPVAALISPIASVAMLILLVRAMLPTEGIAARVIGFREIGWGAICVGLFALAVFSSLQL